MRPSMRARRTRLQDVLRTKARMPGRTWSKAQPRARERSGGPDGQQRPAGCAHIDHRRRRPAGAV